MANAKFDQNNKPTILGLLQSDGVTPTLIKVNPSNNSLKVVNGTTGTASTRTNAGIDDNGIPTWCRVSSVDGKTLIPIAVDSSGNLLIQTT